MELSEVVRVSAPYLESWLGFQLRRSRIPGVQAAVRVGGELVLSTALGLADAVHETPLTRQHLFHIASHSKTFTATACLQLVEAGRLRLDDTAGQWLPDLAGAPAADYTVRELLGHLSGINRDGADADYWQLSEPFPAAEGLLRRARQDAVYGTNEFFKYSNIGYSLLGMIVGAASGRSYNEYVRTEIVDRLGLHDLGPEVPDDRIVDLAAGHAARHCDSDPWRVIPHVGTDAMAAATGFYGTAEELTAYLAAHAVGREELLSAASQRLMRHVEATITKGATRYYGLGFIMCDVHGRRLVGHSGGWPGHISQSWLDPESGLAVSVLTNGLASPAGEWATGLVKLIDLAADFAAEPDPVPDGLDVDGLLGRYENLWGIEDLALLGGQLVAVSPATGDVDLAVTRLSVTNADTLAHAPEAGFGDVGEPIRLQRDAAGTVTSIRSGGMTAWREKDYRSRALPF